MKALCIIRQRRLLHVETVMLMWGLTRYLENVEECSEMGQREDGRGGLIFSKAKCFSQLSQSWVFSVLAKLMLLFVEKDDLKEDNFFHPNFCKCHVPVLYLGPNYCGFVWKEEWATIFPDISVLWLLSYLEIFDIVLIFSLKINFSDYPYISVISFVQ